MYNHWVSSIVFTTTTKRELFMNKIILLSLILSFNIIAQDKYIMLKPLSWNELQLYQLDNLRTADQLELAENCPTSLKNLQETHNKTGVFFQHIEGTNYNWTEYTNIYGLKCIVKHEKIDSITPDKNNIINPNAFELLNNTQARILISASIGGGDTQKERVRIKRIMEINRINQKIQNEPYEKYGGVWNLIMYMSNNTPNVSIQQENKLEYRKASGIASLKTLEGFENTYSKEQQDELIESVKKNIRQSYDNLIHR